MNLLERYKKVQYRYLEWTKRSGNGKECTLTEGKTGPIQMQRQNHISVA